MAAKHAEVLALNKRFRLSALCHTPSSASVAEQWQGRYGLTIKTDDYETFLRSNETDIVWICSPNHLHFEHTRRAIEAGKHVFCEKPLAMSASQAAQLNTLAHCEGRLLAVGMNCRFRRQYAAAKELVETGRLGRLFLLRGTYLYNSERTIREEQKSWWLNRADQPLLLTSGLLHTLDLMVWVAGEVSEVVALGGATVLGGKAGDDTLAIGLRFDDGGIGELIASFAAVRPNDLSLELYGTDASLLGDQLVLRGQEGVAQHRLDTAQPVLDLQLQLENIVEALDGVAAVINDARRAARNLRVCESIQEAIDLRKTISVNYEEF
jgi:predicted dehydrogenase